MLLVEAKSGRKKVKFEVFEGCLFLFCPVSLFKEYSKPYSPHTVSTVGTKTLRAVGAGSVMCFVRLQRHSIFVDKSFVDSKKLLNHTNV